VYGKEQNVESGLAGVEISTLVETSQQHFLDEDSL
jgi:hypothetical protein